MQNSNAQAVPKSSLAHLLPQTKSKVPHSELEDEVESEADSEVRSDGVADFEVESVRVVEDLPQGISNTSERVTRLINDQVNGKEINIRRTEIAGKGSPEVPYQFQQDSTRSVYELNGKRLLTPPTATSVIHTQKNSTEDAKVAYETLRDAVGGEPAGFRLATYCNQASTEHLVREYIRDSYPVTENGNVVGYNLIEKFPFGEGKEVVQLGTPHYSVEVKVGYAIVTLKLAYTGMDLLTDKEAGAIIIQRVVFIPLKELQKEVSEGEIKMEGIRAFDTVSHYETGEEALRQL